MLIDNPNSVIPCDKDIELLIITIVNGNKNPFIYACIRLCFSLIVGYYYVTLGTVNIS